MPISTALHGAAAKSTNNERVETALTLRGAFAKATGIWRLGSESSCTKSAAWQSRPFTNARRVREEGTSEVEAALETGLIGA